MPSRSDSRPKPPGLSPGFPTIAGVGVEGIRMRNNRGRSGQPVAWAAAIAVAAAVAATVLVVVRPGGSTDGLAGVNPAQLAALTATTPSPTTSTSTSPSTTTSQDPVTSEPPSTTTSTDRPVTLLRVAVSQLPEDSEPMIAAGVAPLVTSQVYDTLTALTADQTSVVPGLAEDWEMNAAGSEWTLHLRSGVSFHDGTPLTPAVVCANFQHWSSLPKDKQGDAFDWQYYFGGFAGDQAMTYRNCATDGDDTVRLSFSAAQPYLPAILALPTFGIAAPSTLAGGPPVGTGPYRFTSGDSTSAVLTATGQAQVGRIEFRQIADHQAAAQAVAAGEVDLAGPMSEPVRSTSTPVRYGTASGVEMLIVDQTPGRPLADPKVREAVTAALDTQQLSKIVPGTEPVGTVLPPLLTGGTPLGEPAKADPAHAKQLLAGKPAPTLVLLAPAYRAATEQQLAQAVAAQLKNVGVKVDLKLAKDVNEYLDAYDGKTHADLILASPRTYSVDPIDYMDGITSFANAQDKAAPWRSAYDKLVQRVQDDSDPEQRVRAAVEGGELMVSKGGVIPLTTRSRTWIVSKDLTVEPGGLDYFPLSGVTLG